MTGPVRFLGVGAAVALTLTLAAMPAESQMPVPLPTLTYADMADLGLAAPIVAHVGVRQAVPLKGAAAAGVPAGRVRFYIEADVLSLIRGPAGLPAQLGYLVDLPQDARGRPPKLAKRAQFLILAARVPGRPGEVRLVAPDAQLAFSAQRAEQLRAILREASQADAAPRITGIGKAFHVPGTLAGESETQIFLQTENGSPVSLNVLRRPGFTPRWAVALSEVVDEAAAPPQPGSLLWYRLACTLPRALPPQSTSEAEVAQAAAIHADYRLVLEQLGTCVRNRTRR